MGLVNMLDEILKEEMEYQVFPANKELKFEYYAQDDGNGNKEINNVHVTFESGQTKSFKINDIKTTNPKTIQGMIMKCLWIAEYLDLNQDKSPADIVVKDGSVVSISGYTLVDDDKKPSPYSLEEINKAFLDKIKTQKAFKPE